MSATLLKRPGDVFHPDAYQAICHINGGQVNATPWGGKDSSVWIRIVFPGRFWQVHLHPSKVASYLMVVVWAAIWAVLREEVVKSQRDGAHGRP